MPYHSTMLRPGIHAPDFTATLDDGAEFHLASYEGAKNVVLYFYPRDFTAGCTKEACAFRDDFGALADYNAIVVGVSKDNEASHAAFRARHQLPFPLIADPDRKLIDLYDARGLFGMTARVTYIIDTGGIIRAALHHELLIGRHHSSVKRVLEALQASGA